MNIKQQINKQHGVQLGVLVLTATTGLTIGAVHNIKPVTDAQAAKVVTKVQPKVQLATASDRAKLVTQLGWSRAYRSGTYLPANYNDLQRKIGIAQGLLNNKQSSQWQVLNMVNVLHQAGLNLQDPAVQLATVSDKATLQQRINTAINNKTASYQANDYQILQAKISNAKAVLANNIATRAQVSQAMSGLQQAITATKNVLVLPAGYTNQLLDNNENVINKVANNGKSLNHYISHASDRAQWIADGAHLTLAQQLELTQFTVNLLNPLRYQLGNPPLIASGSAMAFANDIARGYEADNWTLASRGGHDVNRISQVAGTHGLLAGDNYYESLGYGYITPSYRNVISHTALNNLTMDDLKRGVYETIVDMLFMDGSGNNYDHAKDLLGKNTTAYNNAIGNETAGAARQNITQVYFGVSLDNMGQTHFISVTKNQIITPGKFNTTALYK